MSEGRFFLNVPQDRTHYLALIYIAAQQMLGTQGMRGTSVEAQYFEIMQRAEHEYLLRGGDPRNLCGL